MGSGRQVWRFCNTLCSEDLECPIEQGYSVPGAGGVVLLLLYDVVDVLDKWICYGPLVDNLCMYMSVAEHVLGGCLRLGDFLLLPRYYLYVFEEQLGEAMEFLLEHHQLIGV